LLLHSCTRGATALPENGDAPLLIIGDASQVA
jgi:hypothetical protein